MLNADYNSIHLRFSNDVYEELKSIAIVEERPMRGMVKFMLIKFLKNYSRMNNYVYLIPDGRDANTLKEVRQMMKVSGRKVSYLVRKEIVKKIVKPHNVKNDDKKEINREY